MTLAGVNFHTFASSATHPRRSFRGFDELMGRAEGKGKSAGNSTNAQTFFKQGANSLLMPMEC
jgi:hypothetical protein